MCVFLSSLGIPVKLSASCHIMTCFFVDADAVDFSLMTTLFCFISLDTLLATFLFVLSVYVCISLHLSAIFVRLPAWCHIVTCFFVDVVDFSLMTTLFNLFH